MRAVTYSAERPFEVSYVRNDKIEYQSFATLPEAQAFMASEPNSAVTQNGYGIPGERGSLPKPPIWKTAAHHDLRAALLESQTPPRSDEAKRERETARRIREQVRA